MSVMMNLFWPVALLLVLLVTGYRQTRPMRILFLLAGWLLAFTLTSTTWQVALVCWLSFWALAGLFCLPSLRQRLLTRPAFRRASNRLPALAASTHNSLEAGTLDWEAELVSGTPNWRYFDTRPASAAGENTAFDHALARLTDRIVTRQTGAEADSRVAADDMAALIQSARLARWAVPEHWGGRGFAIHSLTRSLIDMHQYHQSPRLINALLEALAIDTSRLLLRHASPAQQDHYLAGLARGELTLAVVAPAHHDRPSGSAPATTARPVRSDWHGQTTAGLLLDWPATRLSHVDTPDAIILCAPMQAGDDKASSSIHAHEMSCILLPCDTPGCQVTRHRGNGDVGLTIEGQSVFVPLTHVLGGPDKLGLGRAAMEEWTAVRQALVTCVLGGGHVNRLLATLDFQASETVPLVDELAGQLGGLAYGNLALHEFASQALDRGETALTGLAITAHQIRHLTQQADNTMADYQAEQGAMRLTASTVHESFSRMIGPCHPGLRSHGYARALLRCHPWLNDKIQAIARRDPQAGMARFDLLHYAHIGHQISMAIRSLVMGITGGLGTHIGRRKSLKHYYQAINRYSANLALLSDTALQLRGLDAQTEIRLGDALADLYLASAALARFVEAEEPGRERAQACWVCERAFFKVETAFMDILRHLPQRTRALIMDCLVFPLGRTARPPQDELNRRISQQLRNQQRLKQTL